MIVCSVEWQSPLQGWLSKRFGAEVPANSMCVGDIINGKIASCVAYSDYNKNMVEVTVAVDRISKAMLFEVFDIAYNRLGCHTIIARVDATNKKSMCFTKHIGFKRKFILEGCGASGADLHVLTMRREECRFLRNSSGDPLETQVEA